MSKENKKPSNEDLKDVVKTIDSLSQKGFSEIGAIARLALVALESPSLHHRTSDDIAKALQAICYMSDDTSNCINCEAEQVGSHYVDESRARRHKAQLALNA